MVAKESLSSGNQTYIDPNEKIEEEPQVKKVIQNAVSAKILKRSMVTLGIITKIEKALTNCQSFF